MQKIIVTLFLSSFVTVHSMDNQLVTLASAQEIKDNLINADLEIFANQTELPKHLGNKKLSVSTIATTIKTNTETYCNIQMQHGLYLFNEMVIKRSVIIESVVPPSCPNRPEMLAAIAQKFTPKSVARIRDDYRAFDAVQ